MSKPHLTIEHFWRTYQQQVLDKTTLDPATLRFCHWSFFGGAHVILEIIKYIGDSPITEEEAHEWLDLLFIEDEGFKQQVSEGKA